MELPKLYFLHHIKGFGLILLAELGNEIVPQCQITKSYPRTSITATHNGKWTLLMFSTSHVSPQKYSMQVRDKRKQKKPTLVVN